MSQADTDEMMRLFQGLDATTELPPDVIVKAPFPMPGCKTRSVREIVPLLPVREIRVETHGGTGIVMMNSPKSGLEVFNDRNSGITDFYLCLKDPDCLQQLIEWLDETINSRDFWGWCKENWQNHQMDQAARAAMWYYMVSYSYNGIGRSWGRTLSIGCKISGKIRNKLTDFQAIHERISKWQIENQSWERIFHDYDTPDTVFYVDPTYLGAHKGTYIHEMTEAEHRRMLDTIFTLEGFVAVSHYYHPLYMEYDWDDAHSWDVFVSVQPASWVAGNKADSEVRTSRDYATEMLFIKE